MRRYPLSLLCGVICCSRAGSHWRLRRRGPDPATGAFRSGSLDDLTDSYRAVRPARGHRQQEPPRVSFPMPHPSTAPEIIRPVRPCEWTQLSPSVTSPTGPRPAHPVIAMFRGREQRVSAMRSVLVESTPTADWAGAIHLPARMVTDRRPGRGPHALGLGTCVVARPLAAQPPPLDEPHADRASASRSLIQLAQRLLSALAGAGTE